MLYRDDGKPLGMIMRYCEDAPTYAWVRVSAARDAGDRLGDTFVISADHSP